MDNALAVAERRVPIAVDRVTDLLHEAVKHGTPVEQLEKLVALQERMEARQAAREFAAAMAAFQAECPSIKKGSTAQIVTKSGSKYGYAYAELDDIARTINPILAKHGLSYSWDSKVEKDTLTCVCTVRHAEGHSVTSSFTLPVDNPSAMNPQQKVGAALTFAQRRSLASVLGLTTTDEDTDTEADPEPITADQRTELEDLAHEAKVDLPRFLKFMGVETLAEIRAVDYGKAMNALNQKRRAAQ